MEKFDRQIRSIQACVARVGFELTYWKGNNAHRLYADSGREHVIVFLELNEYGGQLDGFALQIYFERRQGHRYANEKASIRKRFKPIANCVLIELFG